MTKNNYKDVLKEVFSEILKDDIENKSSSRMWPEDTIAVCRSLMALSSHCMENIASYGTNANVTKEDVEVNLEIIRSCLKLRRYYMNYLKSQYNTNNNYWCSVKHAMEAMQFSEEVWQADITNLDLFLAHKECCANFYKLFSIWTDQPKLVSCGRCLHDMFVEEDEIKEMIEKNKEKNVDNTDDIDIMSVPLK